jgi:hypothetical protein
MLTLSQTLDLTSIYIQFTPTCPSLLPDNTPDYSDLQPSILTSNTADEFDLASSLVLLSETKEPDITSRFRRDADASCVEAKRSTVASISQIPY